jgi:phage terminase large subunit
VTQHIELPYVPRDVWQGFHRARSRWTNLVAHRRSGKTFSMLAEGVARAIEGPANGHYIYCAPFLGQSKAIAWDILRHVAKPVSTKTSEVELWVDLINGSRIRLFGADRSEAMRGLRCNGLLADEYADWSASVVPEILMPMLADTGGWGIFGGTPKGRNHFHEQHERAMLDAGWHSELLPVSKTRLIPEAELEYIKTTMSPEVYAQEFECSFVAPRTGSYWGELVEQARARGRIGDFPHEPDLPVHIACDLGYTDSTAVWYWQEHPDGYRVVDYDEFDSRTLEWWMRLWGAKGYEYGTVWLPHDARAKSLQTGRSTVEQLLSHDVPCQIVPNLDVQHGIDAVRMLLPQCYFHEPTTAQGLKRLGNYRRQFNQKRNAYLDHPLHDENSHGADAFRYFSLVARRPGTREFTPDAPVIKPMDQRFQLEVLWQDRSSRAPSGAHAMDDL